MSKMADVPVPGYQKLWRDKRTTLKAEHQSLVAQADVTTIGHPLLGNGHVFPWGLTLYRYKESVFAAKTELENWVGFWRVGSPR
jgi:hypothetical protein